MENVRSTSWFLLVLGLLAWIAFETVLRENVVERERAHPRGNFLLRFFTVAFTTTVEKTVFPSKW